MEKDSAEKSIEKPKATSEKEGAVDFDHALDYEAMDAGHSDNEPDTKDESVAKSTDHPQRSKPREQVDSSDDSSGQGTNEQALYWGWWVFSVILTGLGSDTLEKLRGRSRSELPSPESEDISRRRDSRKDQRQAISGLSSLAKIYADDETAENNKQGSHEAPKDEGASAVSVDATANAKDDEQEKAEPPKEASEKEKDKQRVNQFAFLFFEF